MMTPRRWVIVLVVILAGALGYALGRPIWYPAYAALRGKRTVADAVRAIGPAGEVRLRPHFREAGVAYPPRRVALLALKAEKQLEVWAEKEDRWVYIHTYPILRASGHAGPKLIEGDCQVPEGLYRVIGLNPNSSFHLSIELDYPNAFDRRKAAEDGRTNLGGDIFIHGGSGSLGCLAMGDPVIEELFAMIRHVGMRNVKVVIVPNDIRIMEPANLTEDSPPWVKELNEVLAREIAPFGRANGG